MDKETRNAIERATQRLRAILEEDFAQQLYGDFDVDPNGSWAEKAGRHLSPQRASQRGKIVAALEHKRAAGLAPADCVADYLRDAAFTTLNRFVALKMLEARELVQECITRGEQSSGYREFCGLAPGVSLLPDSAGYRLYIESLFDELSTEIKVLFDRRDPGSVLWPKRATFEALLKELNTPELTSVWHEDETIGWVYQYFNGSDERKRMREESQAPRNSRELAVRNQFFTPRYVVEFLTDNTLGRIWYEMQGTRTALAERCAYLVRRPGEDIVPRNKKDPRDLKILDPACGSGHFLLYAFELLIAIYEEAQADPEGPRSEATGRTLREDYPTRETLRRDLPALILAHNLHGVDIDARCAQIAQLALWMRAQRAYRDFGIPRKDRPRIRRSNIVVAEPLVSDDRLTEEFVARLGDPALGRMFRELIETLKLAGDLGILLRVEQLLTRANASGQIDYLEPPEEKIRDALHRFVAEEGTRLTMRRRLFADDAVQGLGLLQTAEKKFDVILMNPPFGESTKGAGSNLTQLYPTWNRNIVCTFIARSAELCCTEGLIGAVVDRTVANKTTYADFRRTHLFSQPKIVGMTDLGWDVLDANVEVAALVLAPTNIDRDRVWFIDVRDLAENRERELRELLFRNAASRRYWQHSRNSFAQFPSYSLLYDLPEGLLASFSNVPSMLSRGFRAFTGHQLQSSRHFFCSWEMVQRTARPYRNGKQDWSRLYNGGQYSRFLFPHCEAVRFGFYEDLEPRDVTDYTFVLRNKDVHFRPGVGFGVRGEVLDAHVVSEGFVFTVEGQIIPVEHAQKRHFLAGFLNSSVASRLLNSFSGQHKYSGYVNRLPCPDPDSAAAAAIAALAQEACGIKARWFSHRESCDWWVAPSTVGIGMREIAELAAIVSEHARADEARLEEILTQIDALVLKGLNVHDLESCNDIQAYRFAKMPKEDILGGLFGDDDAKTGLAKATLSLALGCCFGLNDIAIIDPNGNSQSINKRGGILERPLFQREHSERKNVEILVDDVGHTADIVSRLESLLDTTFGSHFIAELLQVLGTAGLRQYLRASNGLFSIHLGIYSEGTRKAPILWQLATPSANYSVWLYLHAVTKDTLFRVQHEYASPKLLHEEQRLESMCREFGENPSRTERRQLEAQESLVAELRTFLEEVARIAPLWNPNLDDGVVINFAPLWRLVQHCASWQRELKSTWDALCEGKYDWAHLAMHLWPERVVPKCAQDRSLAIAHDLEEVFWVENAEGRWVARETPTRSIAELTRERTSSAVKAALESLLNAPVMQGGGRPRARRARATGNV